MLKQLAVYFVGVAIVTVLCYNFPSHEFTFYWCGGIATGMTINAIGGD